MAGKTKLNLERFKKSTRGVIDFAKLIEQATPMMARSIIERTKAEDPKFLNEVLKAVVYFEEICYLDEAVLAEIISVLPAKVLAYSLQGMEPAFREVMLKQTDLKMKRQIADEEEKVTGAAAHGLVLGARKHILKVARKLEQENKITLDLSDAPRFKKKSA